MVHAACACHAMAGWFAAGAAWVVADSWCCSWVRVLSSAALASPQIINTAPLIICRMKEGQAGIFYICTDSKRQAEAAPFTEQLVRKGYEVRRDPLVTISLRVHTEAAMLPCI